jgi:hypothetical protein
LQHADADLVVVADSEVNPVVNTAAWSPSWESDPRMAKSVTTFAWI